MTYLTLKIDFLTLKLTFIYSQSHKVATLSKVSKVNLKLADIWPKDPHLHASSFSNVRLRCNFMGLTILKFKEIRSSECISLLMRVN